MRTWPAMLASVLLVASALPVTGGEGARAGDLGIYHTYDEMVSELENLTAAHPDILRLESIGKTYEGRDLWSVKLSDNVSLDEAEPNITILGGIHAGELIGVEVALHILRSLVENYTTNSTIGWYVNGTQLWFVPMINPDGHVYVEQGNPWRKNRRPNPGGTYGVDLNRNFGHLWGLEASHNPPDDDYCGEYAFSENETQAISKLVTDHPPKITLSYHAFGQYILYPWGNTINQEPVDARLSQIAWNMSFAMPESGRYLPMTAREMYAATGDTDDYFYMNLSVLPFTIELATSNRPLDSAVAGICADNYGPVLYVLNYTVGAPPPPPPKRSLSIEGPDSFYGLPDNNAVLRFTLENTGELDENVSLSVWSNSSYWTTTYISQISPPGVHLDPGQKAAINVTIAVPAYFPAGEPVMFFLNATADSSANASLGFIGRANVLHKLSMWPDFGGLLLMVHSGQVLRGNLTMMNLGNVPETVNLSLNITNATIEADVPGSMTLFPVESRNISATIRVPADALGDTQLRMTATARTTNGDTELLNYTIQVSPSWDLTIPMIQDVTLKEKEKVTVPVTIVNRGNIWSNGTLDLAGDNPLCNLDRTQVNVPPFSNASVNLTISGKKGSGTLNLTFRFDGGNLTQKVRYTIKANETGATAPYDWTPFLLFMLILVVLAVGIGLWWWFVEVPARPRRKDAP